MLELILDQLFELEVCLFAFFGPEDDVKFCQCGFILVELSLHEFDFRHESLSSGDLFKDQLVQARCMILSQHSISVSLDLIIGIVASFSFYGSILLWLAAQWAWMTQRAS